MYNIYKLTSKTENKIYIGQTGRSISTRLNEHKFSATKNPKSELHFAIIRNGINDFSIEILEQCDKSISDDREQFWISEFDSTNIEKGYNKAKGGRGNPGLPVSRETREKLRLANKGFTPESREIIRQKQIGRKLSEEVAQLNRERGFRIAKIVQQYSIEGDFINEFPSIIEASRTTLTDRRTIQRQLSGEYAMNGSGRSMANIKFIWKLKE